MKRITSSPRVPATPGYENASPVILHSHSDMVCIKDEGVDHDFAKDPIRVYAEGDVVTAEGTTLGGDDGIGVAFMMAYMTDKQAKHPALECVFTADEETTMNGGIHLDYSQFKAKYYVNLDGFGFAVGSAGEIDARVLMPRGHEPSARAGGPVSQDRGAARRPQRQSGSAGAR